MSAIACHGKTGNGTGKTSSLLDGTLDSVRPAEVFWSISRGDRDKGRPAWASLEVILPDVLLQPHIASLEFTFCQGQQFPADYTGDIFASEHGSWNKSVRAGYEVISECRSTTPATPAASMKTSSPASRCQTVKYGGRPVGVTVAPDGSLLVSDDGSNSVWRVSYRGK
jgi:glucose/arabinose dehydrogenase